MPGSSEDTMQRGSAEAEATKRIEVNLEQEDDVMVCMSVKQVKLHQQEADDKIQLVKAEASRVALAGRARYQRALDSLKDALSAVEVQKDNRKKERSMAIRAHANYLQELQEREDSVVQSQQVIETLQGVLILKEETMAKLRKRHPPLREGAAIRGRSKSKADRRTKDARRRRCRQYVTMRKDDSCIEHGHEPEDIEAVDVALRSSLHALERKSEKRIATLTGTCLSQEQEIKALKASLKQFTGISNKSVQNTRVASNALIPCHEGSAPSPEGLMAASSPKAFIGPHCVASSTGSPWFHTSLAGPERDCPKCMQHRAFAMKLLKMLLLRTMEVRAKQAKEMEQEEHDELPPRPGGLPRPPARLQK
jgi:hypothetical protein